MSAHRIWWIDYVFRRIQYRRPCRINDIDSGIVRSYRTKNTFDNACILFFRRRRRRRWNPKNGRAHCKRRLRRRRRRRWRRRPPDTDDYRVRSVISGVLALRSLDARPTTIATATMTTNCCSSLLGPPALSASAVGARLAPRARVSPWWPSTAELL